MNDQRQPSGAPSLPMQLLQPLRDIVAPLPVGFVPLNLMLLPAGMPVELTKPNVLIGRHSSADVRLPLPDVSRQHCRFVFAQGAWHVVDLDSLNGIYVNNQRVQRAVIHMGDRIRIGGFIFEVGSAATAHTTAEAQAPTSLPLAAAVKAPVKREQRRAS